MTMTLAADFGARLREVREWLGETQAEFAERWYRTAKQISAWEVGRQTPHLSMVQRIAAAQAWPIEIFLEGGPRPMQKITIGGKGRGVVGESLESPYAPRGVSGMAAGYVATIIRELHGKFGQGATVTAEDAAAYINTLWTLVLTEAPQLKPPERVEGEEGRESA